MLMVGFDAGVLVTRDQREICRFKREISRLESELFESEHQSRTGNEL